MKKTLSFLVPVFICQSFLVQSSCIQGDEKKNIPAETTIYHKLGEQTIQIRVSVYGNGKDLVLLNLHDDEKTSVDAARQFLATNPGMLIRLENNGERKISFRVSGKEYMFDPNRMFSRPGIIRTLEKNGGTSHAAIAEVEKFATRILGLIPKNITSIIALHNNDDGDFSITSYLPGNANAKDSKEVSINSAHDPDNFYLTTDSSLYKSLVQQKYNIVWQDNFNADKDGSLSIYCGERNIRYINCETEHDKILDYVEMLRAAGRVLKD
jgi:hypothetical protein